MTITVDQKTALRGILKLFDALGPDGKVAEDVEQVELILSCSTAGQPDRLSLYERPAGYGEAEKRCRP